MASRRNRSPIRNRATATGIGLGGLVAIAAALLLGGGAGTTAVAATLTTPPKKHAWALTREAGRPVARAYACPTCPAALELKCALGPGSGLLALTLPVGAVANGREAASKTIRLILAGHVFLRRAVTERQRSHFVPRLDVAGDDRLLDRVEESDLLQINFYGQRAYVGLGADATRAIRAVRRDCGPVDGTGTGRRICTWHVPLGCYATEAAARRAGAARAGVSVVERTGSQWCLAAATDDLAAARRLGEQVDVDVRRSCMNLPPDAHAVARPGAAETAPAERLSIER